MPRWIWFAPLGLLVLAVGLWAFRLGWIAATLTESDVIATYSRHYLAQDPGARAATDCTAQPGDGPDLWIVVTCITARGERVDFPVDRFGRLLDISPMLLPADAPKT